MKIEQINHLNFPINARQDMRDVARSGSLAAQVDKVKTNILDNIVRQRTPTVCAIIAHFLTRLIIQVNQGS